MKRNRVLTLILSVVVSCSLFAWAQQNPVGTITPVTDEMLANPDPGDWLMWRRTYDAWGYSPLDQITKENVQDLQVAWSWSMTNGATEVTPLVHDGILYLHNYGDRVQALNAVTGNLIWEYVRDLPPELVEAGGNTLTSRNLAIYQDKVYLASSDAHIVALDANTGQVVFDYQVVDWQEGWGYTPGPLVVKGMVIQGMTRCGNAQPGGCFITAHDAETGEELWRRHTIAQPGEPGDETWNGLPVESRFGGSAWITGSYDPELDLLFWGVGQPYPWIAEMSGLLPASTEPGISNDALYTDSTLALDPDTGEIVWYYQHLPNDTWDLDYAYERILLDQEVDGEMRQLLVTVGKPGIIEVLDRTSGEFLWSKETVPQNVIASVDAQTGEKTINEESIPHIGETTVNCPADPGGRGWPATAYSPLTQSLYLPLNEFCSDTTPTPLEPGEAYTGGGRAVFARRQVPNSDGNVGRVDAVNLSNEETLWSHRQYPPQVAAMLATGGGLVFTGDWDRNFRAFDDTTGEVLWQIRVNNAVNSYPVSYAVDGKQYIAVAVGNGSSLARALATLTPDLVNPQGGSALWVFTLPE
jgi:alcohol dehydrogenase (cytochrome c)